MISTEGPLLVLAGAGTGKTRVLTTRVAHILATRNAWPSQMLVVTFTNKAAREMRERTLALVGPDGEGLRWFGTFHSVSAQILRRHAELAKLKSGFTVLDTDDQLRLIRQILEAENIDQKRWTPRYLASLIDGWKNRAIWPGETSAGRSRASSPTARAQKLYEIYQDRLAILNAVDFGDLLLHTIRIFTEHPDVLADYHAQVPLPAGRRVPGHQRRAVSLAAASCSGKQQHLLRGRRRPVDLWLARRRGGQHPALRAAISPARK